jgi:hypothetical protein
MLSSVSLTFNFTVDHEFDQNRLISEITAAIRAAAAHPQDQNESARPIEDTSVVFKELADKHLESLVTGEILDEGWGQVKDLARVIATLPRNQQKVVIRAVENGGQISRSEMFELLGRSEDQSLKGFTKPVRILMGKLQANQDLPLDAVALLRPIYDGSSRFQQAQGFKVPMQVVVKMRPDLS